MITKIPQNPKHMGSVCDIQICVDPQTPVTPYKDGLGSTQPAISGQLLTTRLTPPFLPAPPPAFSLTIPAPPSQASFLPPAPSFPIGVPRAQAQLLFAPVLSLLPALLPAAQLPPSPNCSLLCFHLHQSLPRKQSSETKLPGFIHPGSPLTSCVTLGELTQSPHVPVSLRLEWG